MDRSQNEPCKSVGEYLYFEFQRVSHVTIRPDPTRDLTFTSLSDSVCDNLHIGMYIPYTISKPLTIHLYYTKHRNCQRQLQIR